jgi:methionyl-tRNA formyltransferase
VRLRKWYRQSGIPRIDDLCREFSLPFVEVPFINCDETVDIFKAAQADLGLSLGNGYIARRVFSIPKHGMINLHSEVLPRFQGASSIIWPIHALVPETGFTIHQVNNRIDQGAILYRHVQPIIFHDTLRKTVEANLRNVLEKTPTAMLRACDEYENLSANAEPQESGPGFTTPNIFQYWRMVRNHARMRAEYLRDRNGFSVAADAKG